MDRLNTRNILKRKKHKLEGNNYNCVLCSNNVEETAFHCPFSQACWRLLGIHWDFGGDFFPNDERQNSSSKSRNNDLESRKCLHEVEAFGPQKLVTQPTASRMTKIPLICFRVSMIVWVAFLKMSTRSPETSAAFSLSAGKPFARLPIAMM